MSMALTSGKVLCRGEDGASMSVRGAGKGFFARVLDAMIAARQAQADREIARYIQVTGLDQRM